MKSFKIAFYRIFVFVYLVFLVLFISFIYTSNKQADKQRAYYEAHVSDCDTIKTINEYPEISFRDFEPQELKKIEYYLIENNQILADTIVYVDSTENFRGYYSTKLPFINFNKNDSIIVKTNDSSYYVISNFHYYFFSPHQHALSDACEFEQERYTINGIEKTSEIRKSKAEKSNSLIK